MVSQESTIIVVEAINPPDSEERQGLALHQLADNREDGAVVRGERYVAGILEAGA
jgi:hypothetical protein